MQNKKSEVKTSLSLQNTIIKIPVLDCLHKYHETFIDIICFKVYFFANRSIPYDTGYVNRKLIGGVHMGKDKYGFYILRTSFTDKNGIKHYASSYGKRCFKIYVNKIK